MACRPEICAAAARSAGAEDADADAVLLIGDRAMHACLPGFRARLRPRPGMARLDRPAVRLRGLGGARRASISGRWRTALHEAKRRGLRERRPDRRARGAAPGPRRRLLPPLPDEHHPLRSRPARTGRAAAVLHAGVRAGPGAARVDVSSTRRRVRRLAVRAVQTSLRARTSQAMLAIRTRCHDRHRRILDKAVDGERLTFDEGVALFDCNDLHALGRAADAVTPPAAPRAVSHLQHRPQHQLHERLRRRLRLLRLLPQDRATPTPTSCRARSCTRRSRRRSPSAATRSCMQGGNAPVAEAGVVRGTAPRPEGALSRRSTCTPSARRRSGTSTSSTSCRCARCCSA